MVTTILGALFLVALARNVRITGAAAESPTASTRVGVPHYRILLGALAVVAVGVVIGSLLLGDTKLLMGDVLTG